MTSQPKIKTLVLASLVCLAGCQNKDTPASAQHTTTTVKETSHTPTIPPNAPKASNLSISPAIPAPGLPARCSYDFSDPNGGPDKSSVTWKVEGKMLEGKPSNILPGDAFGQGKTIECIVTPNNGTLTGSPTSKVGRSASLKKLAILKPNKGLEGDYMDANSIQLGDQAVLALNDGTHGVELWVSDGTRKGTTLLKDIYPGPESGMFRSRILKLKDRVVFRANDGIHGRELWISDGTKKGTTLLKDIAPQPSYSSLPSNFFTFQDKLFFSANEKERGEELWISDGTKKGTTLLKDIQPGKYGSTPTRFFTYKDKLFFNAREEKHGHELWTTDGTKDGTTLFREFALGKKGSNTQRLLEHGGLLYFNEINAETVKQLWIFNGEAFAHYDDFGSHRIQLLHTKPTRHFLIITTLDERSLFVLE